MSQLWESKLQQSRALDIPADAHGQIGLPATIQYAQYNPTVTTAQQGKKN